MKIDCPKCKCKFDFENTIRICNKDVATNRAKEIKSFYKKVSDSKKRTFNKVLTYVNNDWVIDSQKTTQDILYNLGLDEYTKGDFLRVILDSMVCTGLITKEFMRGKKGHKYTKLSLDENKQCNFWLPVDNWCTLHFQSSGKERKVKELFMDNSYLIKKHEKEED